jgi:hypothetical protein
LGVGVVERESGDIFERAQAFFGAIGVGVEHAEQARSLLVFRGHGASVCAYVGSWRSGPRCEQQCGMGEVFEVSGAQRPGLWYSERTRTR